MSAAKGAVKAALEAHLAAGKTAMTAARLVFESGITSGNLRSVEKYASLLKSGADAPMVRAVAPTSGKECNLPAPRFARFRVEYDGKTGKHVVVSPEGRRVWGPGTQAIAQAKRDALQADQDAAKKRGPRACLCCGKGFQSEGIHNRMCDGCRRRDDALGAYGYAGAADGRKPRKSAGAF